MALNGAWKGQDSTTQVVKAEALAPRSAAVTGCGCVQLLADALRTGRDVSRRPAGLLLNGPEAGSRVGSKQ